MACTNHDASAKPRLWPEMSLADVLVRLMAEGYEVRLAPLRHAQCGFADAPPYLVTVRDAGGVAVTDVVDHALTVAPGADVRLAYTLRVLECNRRRGAEGARLKASGG